MVVFTSKQLISYIINRGKTIIYIDEKEKLCMSPRTHATTKQGKEKKTTPYKWAWQGKVQLKIKMSIVQFSTNHSLQSLAMNIRLDDEIDAAAAAKSNILLQFERVLIWMKLTQF